MRFGHIIHDSRVINTSVEVLEVLVKNGEKNRYVMQIFHVLMVMLMADKLRKSTRERKPPERLHNTVDSESLSSIYVANVRLRKRKQEKDTEWRRQRREDCDYREAEQLEDTERRRQRREDARKRRVTGTDAEYN